MNAYTNDDIVIVEMTLKRGKSKTVRFRSSNYQAPAHGWQDTDFQEMAAAQVDKWLLIGAPRITHVIPCN